MKNERCERCPDEDTSKCETCREPEAEQEKFTYTFYLREGICGIDVLHRDLDNIIFYLGFEVVRSTLESPDEESEHDFEEGDDPDADMVE